mmetsp:Transcript_181238/g.575177  ORF Transcript_181238/g.575177 Transcript_181238/m.575177 type:complete len:126 (-) Transcript_181238:214-591(-)
MSGSSLMGGARCRKRQHAQVAPSLRENGCLSQAETFDTALFQLHGIDVTPYSLVALKSCLYFRTGFRDLPNGFKPTIVTSDALGTSSDNMDSYDNSKACCPLWPVCQEVEYKALADEKAQALAKS